MKKVYFPVYKLIISDSDGKEVKTLESSDVTFLLSQVRGKKNEFKVFESIQDSSTKSGHREGKNGEIEFTLYSRTWNLENRPKKK